MQDTTRPFPENGGETQQSGHTPRSGPEVKMEEVVTKMVRRRDSDTGQGSVRSCR